MREVIGLDNEVVRIHNHYAVITDDRPFSITHPIRKFDITEQDHIEKYTPYQFMKDEQFLALSLDLRSQGISGLLGSSTEMPE